MEEEDQFMPDLTAMLEVSLVEENAPTNAEETQTTAAAEEEEKKEETTEKDTSKPEEPAEKPQDSSAAETPQPEAPQTFANAITTPGANGDPFALPNLANATEQQKELHNFKLSLLPTDINEEEKAFYINAIDDIKSITCMRLHCTVCNEHIGCQPEAMDNTFSHIKLHVLMCKQCFEFYGNGDFTMGADGSETYCFWCGQGGQVYCCSTCPHVFCKKCVRLNFGRKAQKEIEDSNDWSCYTCKPKTLWEFKAQCWGLLAFNEMRKNNLVSFTTEEELRLPGYNLVECCNIQRRAGKPLKIISFRYLIKKKPAEKKENEEKAGQNDTVNNKSKSMSTSNGKVTFPFKPPPGSIIVAEGDPVVTNTEKAKPKSPAPVPIPTSIQPAIKVKTPGNVNASIFASPVAPPSSAVPEVIVPTPVSSGSNTNQVNYVNPTTSTTQRRTPIVQRKSGGFLLASLQTHPPKLVPLSNSMRQTPMAMSKNASTAPKPTPPPTYDIDDDDDVIIIDEAFDNAIKKMDLDWMVKTFEQAERVSKRIQHHCQNIKQTLMSELKSNKVDAKRVRSFSGKLHNMLKGAAVKLTCLDDKFVTEAFSNWLKAEKLKQQKVPPPPVAEAAPKEDLCLDMEIDCESDNEEGEDDFETAFTKSVLECSETLSDVEFEDEVLNTAAQRKHLASLKQQASSPRSNTDKTDAQEDAASGSKPAWSGAYSSFLTNRSDTSNQNGAPSSTKDKAGPDEANSPSEVEFVDPLAEDATPAPVEESLKRPRSTSPDTQSKKIRLEMEEDRSKSPLTETEERRNTSPVTVSNRIETTNLEATKDRNKSPALDTVKDRSKSPKAKSEEQRSKSPKAETEEHRSKSPISEKEEHRGKSPASETLKDRNKSPSREAEKDRNKSPSREAEKDRNKSLKDRNKSPSREAEKDRNKSLKDRNKSPSREAEKDRNKSPMPTKERDRNKPPAPETKKDKKNFPVLEAEKDRNKSPAPETKKDRNNAPVLEAEKDRNKSPLPKAVKDRNKSPAPEAKKDRNKSPAPEAKKDRNKSPTPETKYRNKFPATETKDRNKSPAPEKNRSKSPASETKDRNKSRAPEAEKGRNKFPALETKQDRDKSLAPEVEKDKIKSPLAVEEGSKSPTPEIDDENKSPMPETDTSKSPTPESEEDRSMSPTSAVEDGESGEFQKYGIKNCSIQLKDIELSKW